MKRGFCVVNHFLGFVYLLVSVYLFDLGGGCRGVFILWKFIELSLRSVSFSICTDTQFQVASCISQLWSSKNQSFKMSVAFNTNSFLFVAILRMPHGLYPSVLPLWWCYLTWGSAGPAGLLAFWSSPRVCSRPACPVLLLSWRSLFLPSSLPRCPRSPGAPWGPPYGASSAQAQVLLFATSSLCISWLEDKIIKVDLT